MLSLLLGILLNVHAQSCYYEQNILPTKLCLESESESDFFYLKGYKRFKEIALKDTNLKGMSPVDLWFMIEYKISLMPNDSNLRSFTPSTLSWANEYKDIWMYEKNKYLTPEDSNMFFAPSPLIWMDEYKRMEDAGLISIVFRVDSFAKPFIILQDSVINMSKEKCWYSCNYYFYIIWLPQKLFIEDNYFILSFKQKEQKRALIPILADFMCLDITFHEEKQLLDIDYSLFSWSCGE